MQAGNTSPLPIFFKCIAAITILTGILSLFTSLPAYLLSDYPRYTVFYLNIWRVFTSCLVSPGLFMSLTSTLIMFFIMPEIVIIAERFRKRTSRVWSRWWTFLLRMW